MATNRPGLLACSRIAQACSWASPNIEVIIRDNSGNAQKRDLLTRFRNENSRIIIAEPCDGLTNFSEVLKLATGEFVFLLADDDFCFDHAVAALPSAIEQIASDPTVIGLTGLYAIETSQASSIIGYRNVESEDVTQRMDAFLGYEGPNILHYAPVRTELVRRVFAFMRTLPFYFSFHDQIVCVLYLMNGRFARLNRLLYLYDIGVWQTAETAQKKDLEFYKDAGTRSVDKQVALVSVRLRRCGAYPQLDPFSFGLACATPEHGRSVVFGNVSPVQEPTEIYVRNQTSPAKRKNCVRSCGPYRGSFHFMTWWQRSAGSSRYFLKLMGKPISTFGTRSSTNGNLYRGTRRHRD